MCGLLDGSKLRSCLLFHAGISRGCKMRLTVYWSGSGGSNGFAAAATAAATSADCCAAAESASACCCCCAAVAGALSEPTDFCASAT